VGLDNGARKIWIGLFGARLRNKLRSQKKLLAMTIASDTNERGGLSPGSISRNYEGVGNSSVCPYFGRLLRPALRGRRLQFRRDSGQCSVYSQ
jgi:hypothetical protein